MSYPMPPFGAGPSQPPTTPGPMYPPPFPPYGYARPPEPLNTLVSIGGALAALGGLVIGIGWVAPTDLYWVLLGIGWMMFGPGVGVALLGVGKRPR